MIPECLNSGGPASMLRLAATPDKLEVEVPGEVGCAAALAAWQARPGEIFSVVGPDGAWYRARLASAAGEEPRFIPFERIDSSVESPLALTVCQALPDKERFELIIEKLTELGVARIVPYQSRRSSTLSERDGRQKKSHRWPELLVKAAKQCRRGMLPELYPVVTWDQALYFATRADLKLLLYERERAWRLGEQLNSAALASVALLVGPEGGFETEEVAAARELGILPVGLGPRVLRTETAAIAATTLVQHRLGDLQ